LLQLFYIQMGVLCALGIDGGMQPLHRLFA
jgi:hypothetical protein